MTHEPTHVDLSIDQALAAAVKLEKEGDSVTAERIYRTIIELQPSAEAQCRLGVLLAARGDYYESLYRFDRALKIKRKYPWAMSNRGMLLGQLGHHDEALCEFEKAIAAMPQNAVVWNNYTNVLERVGRFGDALKAIERCLELDPNHEMGYYNKSIVLYRLKRTKEAIDLMSKSIEIDPNNWEAYYNRGVGRLSIGDFGGFEDYEYRLKTECPPLVGPFTQPKWHGESLKDKTILVHAEQGIGDSIQFVRYIPWLTILGAKVYLILHTAMVPAFDCPGVTVLRPKEPMPTDFDYHSELLSLPLAFKTMLETVPDPWPFNQHDALEGQWRERLRGEKVKVGVCWSGNFRHKNDEHRSIDLSLFSQIFDVTGVNFYSLQKEIRPVDAKAYSTLSIADLADELRSFADTACAVRNLDLVISVDTSVAHMAASVGTPTWILIPWLNTDWRWMQDGENTPWYPSAHLFRQPKMGDWRSVLSRVQRELRNCVADKIAA
jgi:Tfp pilus assembly protein PilF